MLVFEIGVFCVGVFPALLLDELIFGLFFFWRL